MKINDYVRLTKIDRVANPFYPTPKKEDFIPGAINPGVTLPLDYTVTGRLRRDIEVNKGIDLDRYTRNGVAVDGYFFSSVVRSIDGDEFSTANSVYKVETITEEEAKGISSL